MENPIDTSEPAQSTTLGRRLSFVLGAAGLLLVILGGLAAWLPWHRQAKVIAEIERLGGYVETVPVGPDWLRDIVGDEVMLGYDHVVGVQFEFGQLTDAVLAHLKGLTNLRFLIYTTTTDAGLVHLKDLTKLQELNLSGAQVTDVGLVHLKNLTELQWVFLDETLVTDAGIVDLQTALPKCEIRMQD